MNDPADQPPLVPVVSGPTGPRVSLPTGHPIQIDVHGESRLTKVARVLAIVRDVMVIVVMAAVIYFGSAILARVGDGVQVDDGVTSGEVPACDSPTVDQWGTFCPETPGG